MTKSKTTKRALLNSVFALLLCFIMLLGTTFAWFTDTVSTTVNKIQAGTLDIVLEYKEGANWVDAQNKTLNFKKVTGAENDPMLWEPGCTYELPEIRVRNNGNIALEYQIVVNGVVGSAKLLEAIEWTANGKDLTTFNGTLLAKGDTSAEIVIKGHMKEDAGNEYQGLTLNGIGITVYASQLEHEYDSYGNQYDAGAFVKAATQEAAQAALDNAATGTTIVLENGVEYGTLYLRQSDLSQSVDVTDWSGDSDVERYRKIEGLTIIGNGANVDAIKIEAHQYAPNGNQHSNSATTPRLSSYIMIKGLVIDGVNFTGEAKNALHFSNQVGVDGLAIKNCTMTDNGDSRLFYTDIADIRDYTDKNTQKVFMTRALKNISIIDCEVTGAYQVAEFRGTENITITGNTSTGIKARDYLLSGGGYSGNVTISNNTSNGGTERFIRAAGMDNTNLTITNNTVTNYAGANADYIKIDGCPTDAVIENNTISYDAATQEAAQAALDNAATGTTIILKNGVEYGTLYLRQSDISQSVDVTDWSGDSDVERYRKIEGLTIIGNGANVDAIKIEAHQYAPNGNQHSNSATTPRLSSYIMIKGLVIDGVNFTGGAKNALHFSNQVGLDGLTIKNCTMTDDGDSRLFYTDIADIKDYTDKNTQEVFMTRGLKNISIIDCEVTGAYQVAEFRGTENITITGNTSTEIKARDYLLSGGGYSGNVTISNNTSNGGTERFIRAAGMDNTNLTITNNTVTNYAGANADYIKIGGCPAEAVISGNAASAADGRVLKIVKE